jgi:heme-degrading monooxygenase HmoA
LRLKGVTADDPVLLQSLSTVRGKLHTRSQFYNCIEDPTIIYILGIWPSLDAHLEFLASPARDEFLGPQDDMLDFCWTIHVELGGIRLLPLGAPVLAIERICVKGEYVEVFNQAVTRHTKKLQGSHPFKVVHGWRCDAARENHELVLFTGYETAQAHAIFATKKIDTDIDIDIDIAAIDKQYETTQVIHAWNLEREEASTTDLE